MKRATTLFFKSVILLVLVLTQSLCFAQQWSGTNTLDATISRTGNIELNRNVFGSAQLSITNTAESTGNYSSYWEAGNGGNIDSQTRILLKNTNAGTGFLNGLYLGLDQAYAVKAYTLGSKDATPLTFYTSGKGRMSIGASGSVTISRNEYGISELQIVNAAENAGNYSSYWNAGIGGNADSQTRLLLKNPNAGPGFINGMYIGLDQTNAIKSYTMGSKDATPLCFYSSGNERVRITPDGNVGIGASDTKGYKLAIAGKVVAEELNIKLQANWPDYVFEPTYVLRSLDSVQSYINENKHLPEVPSAKEMNANGVNVGEMNMLLLKKVEELTLYVIELKQNDDQRKKEIEELRKQLK